MTEQAFLSELIKNDDIFIKIKEYKGIHFYFEGQVSKKEMAILKTDENYEKDLLDIYAFSIDFFHLTPIPKYFVLSQYLPPDNLLACAFNDGIKIFLNDSCPQFFWKWIIKTTIMHEVGHIYIARKNNQPILFRDSEFTINKIWEAMDNDLQVNENLPNEAKVLISNLICLSILDFTQQNCLLEPSLNGLPNEIWLYDANLSHLLRRMYSIPRDNRKILDFLNDGKEIKHPYIQEIRNVILNNDYSKFVEISDSKKVIDIILNCMYLPNDKYHNIILNLMK
ncbi:MAG: hypothetical protein PHS34_09280 [Candidatus Omnitrophica bacterium]|nr:hypothetical protein [Candidatus Nanoarchaeia archaeon]MDD5551439.1 hypothetical protein [Candidatus Omnitrophota bacterium]